MDQFEQIEDTVRENFNSQLNFINKIEMTEKSTQEVQDQQILQLHEDEDESEEDDGDFSFVFNGDGTAPIPADAQIRPFFPLFDRDLLTDYDSESSEDRLPHQPPVKVFVESSNLSSSSSESDEIDGVAAGPYCVWTKKSTDKKSNSTGFSKLWRFRDFGNRSNSDGKDAFVFLNNSKANKVESSSEKRPASESALEKKTLISGEMKNNGNGAGGKVKAKKAGKGNTAPLSSHEIYMRNKGMHQDRRRSYLPYRPELMGFFTNVHGGLNRNVHPF